METPYSIVVDSEPLTPCFVDVNEPNDTLEMATVATSSLTPPNFDATGLQLCVNTASAMTGRGDRDYFSIVAEPGHTISATLTHTSGDLSLELLSPPGDNRACINFRDNRCYSDGAGLTETITFTATTSRPYYLLVDSIFSDPLIQQRPSGADTAYDLSISVTPP